MWFVLYALGSGIIGSFFDWPILLVWCALNGVLAGWLAGFSHDMMAFLYDMNGDGDSDRWRTMSWMKWQFIRTARFRIKATEMDATIEVAFFGLLMWSKWFKHVDRILSAKTIINVQYAMLMRASYWRTRKTFRVIDVKRPAELGDW